MQFFILVLLVCLFTFLYCVFVLSNDDFIFLRRDVTMEKLFNIVFLASFVSLFGARLFYGFSAVKIFANPLKFLLIPYFPGLSLLGGVVGIGAYLLFLLRRRDNLLPIARISDFFSLAFLISLPIGFVGFLLFSEKSISFIKPAAQALAYFVLFITFITLFLPRLLNGKFKEGTITFLFLISFSIVSLVSNAFFKIHILEYFKNFENIILILIFGTSLIMLIRREGLSSKFKQFKKGK